MSHGRLEKREGSCVCVDREMSGMEELWFTEALLAIFLLFVCLTITYIQDARRCL